MVHTPKTREKKLSGIEKVALIVLYLPDDLVLDFFSKLEDHEIRDVSLAMTRLGNLDFNLIKEVQEEFTTKICERDYLCGTVQTTERFLSKFFSKRKVDDLLQEAHTCKDSLIWNKLNEVCDEQILLLLKDEHPQTLAFILSKMAPQKVACIFDLLPESLSMDVMARFMNIDPVHNDIQGDVEGVLGDLFESYFSRFEKEKRNDAFAQVLNHMDPQREHHFIEILKNMDDEFVNRMKGRRSQFDDLVKFDEKSIQLILKCVDKTTLAVALKGASQDLFQSFITNMSPRAVRMVLDDIENIPSLYEEDIKEAQKKILALVKEMIKKNIISSY